ncbi:ead/Ea22-like family protein [Citrobacter sp. RHBSTW-00944]|uniref:ead/Ea22-like family protein n=1 Tax=Citrobacter sp. RHBSTW-00944 TaxID=2742671 RepID=UPI0015E58F8B|nr:ead/Ea22-like family protein [Citrobacter sp. RHBSTW-00944]QLO83691.1 ead/Ea22-like family protein [Citrobacter sp. RHBSTW-00944]
MTALNKRAYRADGGDIGSGRLKEIAGNAYGDEEKRWLAQRVLALLDENLQLQRDKDSLEAVAIAMRDDMREAREKLEAAEKRISDLETKKADLMAHVLNGYEATALTMTLRKMDVYLPDYLRFCAIYGVDHDAIMDKLDYQSFVLARVNNDDLRQDLEASHD